MELSPWCDTTCRSWKCLPEAKSVTFNVCVNGCVERPQGNVPPYLSLRRSRLRLESPPSARKRWHKNRHRGPFAYQPDPCTKPSFQHPRAFFFVSQKLSILYASPPSRTRFPGILMTLSSNPEAPPRSLSWQLFAISAQRNPVEYSCVRLRSAGKQTRYTAEG